MNTELVTRIKALAEPVRLRILETLPGTKECSEVYNVTELAEELELPQSTVSRHLAILLRANLVSNERMCRDVYYWVNQSTLNEVCQALNGIGGNETPFPESSTHKKKSQFEF